MTSIANRQAGVDLMKWVRGVSNLLLSDFPADKLTYQPSPTDNHVAWVLGHMISTDAWIAKELNIPGISIPDSYKTLFGGGSKPLSDARQYPTLAELKRQFDQTHEVVMKWFESAPDSALQVDLKERSGGFTSDPVDAMFKLAWHEGWHFGQVASIRKALGLPSKLG